MPVMMLSSSTILTLDMHKITPIPNTRCCISQPGVRTGSVVPAFGGGRQEEKDSNTTNCLTPINHQITPGAKKFLLL